MLPSVPLCVARSLRRTATLTGELVVTLIVLHLVATNSTGAQSLTVQAAAGRIEQVELTASDGASDVIHRPSAASRYRAPA